MSRSPPFQGGDVQESPFWGDLSPTLGSRVPPRLPKKGTWANVPPGVPPSRGRDPHPGGRVLVEHFRNPRGQNSAKTLETLGAKNQNFFDLQSESCWRCAEGGRTLLCKI